MQKICRTTPFIRIQIIDSIEDEEHAPDTPPQTPEKSSSVAFRQYCPCCIGVVLEGRTHTCSVDEYSRVGKNWRRVNELHCGNAKLIAGISLFRNKSKQAIANHIGLTHREFSAVRGTTPVGRSGAPRRAFKNVLLPRLKWPRTANWSRRSTSRSRTPSCAPPVAIVGTCIPREVGWPHRAGRPAPALS